MKIEVLPERLNAECRGKCPAEEKLRAVLSEAVQKIGVARLASGDDSDPAQRTVMVLAMACQMLWNRLEDVQAELERADAIIEGYQEEEAER